MHVQTRRRGLSDVEIEIYQGPDAFFPSAATRERVQRPLLEAAFALHHQRNPGFRRYCEALGVGPDAIREDVRRIPLLPSTLFKSTRLWTDSGERVVLRCQSSGTQGSVSTVERDNTTLERFLGTIRNALDHVHGVEDAVVLNLGPPAEEARSVWFSYVMSVTDLVFETRHYVRDGTLRVEEVLSDLRRESARTEVLLIGAPVMFLDLFEALEKRGERLALERPPRIITAGGWKRREDRAIPPDEFRRACRRVFPGLEDEHVRDTYNMVELNTILPECEHHHKHVPVWLDAFVLDLDTYRPAPRGRQGLLAFLDASPTSFPGFIMSGDLGCVTHVDDCPCGRPGVCVEVRRRVNTIEARGCALRIASGVVASSEEGR